MDNPPKIPGPFDLYFETFNMNFSCAEYRHTQQLLALRKRLAEEDLTPEERKKLEELIRQLEEELGL